MNRGLIGYFIIIVLLAAACVTSINLFFMEKTSSDKLHISAFPYQMGQWQGRDLEVTEKEYKILETRNLLLREYTNPSGASVVLFVIYSETNRSVFHPPEVCLIGSGVCITDKRAERIRFGGYDFMANKIDMDKNGVKEIALYVYKAGNIYTDNFYFQQAHIALRQIFKKNIPGATIRVSTIVTRSEEKSLGEIKDFLEETITTLERLQ